MNFLRVFNTSNTTICAKNTANLTTTNTLYFKKTTFVTKTN